MVAVFKDIETQALALPERERSALVARLLDSLDSVFDDSPEAVERAWDEEVARRVKEFESGAGQDISHIDSPGSDVLRPTQTPVP